jgi:hypothetical protein
VRPDCVAVRVLRVFPQLRVMPVKELLVPEVENFLFRGHVVDCGRNSLGEIPQKIRKYSDRNYFLSFLLTCFESVYYCQYQYRGSVDRYSKWGIGIREFNELELIYSDRNYNI